ncbi:MAG: hypothetical protein GOMPHAMPRED_001347 [Gomphillus americanus]|uniref:Uncharacterized protein n=1 Tax=Gomphillus americanus TaxID=1940652 RepID=A0A8H3IJC4_9LECA|nr:MAG: hypothetical protein GOMPHAMPRED_001347 [Gomphillus americanus]
MRTSITIAAIAAVASTVAAYDYEEDIFAREADAEPIFGLNHIGKWMGEAVGSVKEGYNIKAHGSERNGYGSDSQYRRDIEDLEELLAIREAEPILGMNHVGKWIGQAVGSVKGGYNQKANGGFGGSEHMSHDYSQQYKRDVEDLEELLAIREAEAEPILGLNHVGKWIGQAAGSVKGGYNKKANGGMGGSEYSQAQQYKRDLDALEILLAIRDAEAEAEPILGLNHAGKWMGQAAGSVKAGFNKKAGGGAPYSETTIQQYRRDLFEDDEFDF